MAVIGNPPEDDDDNNIEPETAPAEEPEGDAEEAPAEEPEAE